VIVLHAHVSAEREQAIAALGAQIVRMAGNYDDSVQEAARLAAEQGWQVISDTSYAGYEDIPRDVMQGYAASPRRSWSRPGAPGEAGAFTHVLLQGGWAAGRRPGQLFLGVPRRAAALLHRRRAEPGRLPAAKRAGRPPGAPPARSIR
jgi:hypothetical protein